MFKYGDDLRQDQLILQMINYMDSLLKKVHLDYEFTTYKVLATSKSDGFVEFVPNSRTIFDILKKYGKKIRPYYDEISKGDEKKLESMLDSYINSCAGYCVITYILGIGDRHLENLMIDEKGRLFHIDFGFILGKDPKPYPPPIKLCQEMVDYMLTAIDQYSVLPPEIQENIMELIASLDNVNPEGWYNAPSTPDISDEAVNQIKSCAQSCEWLRADQYVSCLEMCACAERTSEIFNPEWGLGLWPLAKIKFCTVPGRDMSFSEWWRKIISIEEWWNEIWWVVDKLSREWKLWVWTKQSNFLDSSTKKIKIDKVISFSIDVQSVDIWEKPKESSEQYENKMLKNINKELQKK